jgi:hypothetical protein
MSDEYKILIDALIKKYKICKQSLTEKEMRILLDYFIVRGAI